MKNPEFLQQKYSLKKSKEVKHTADVLKSREKIQAEKEDREPEKISKAPSARIQAYLDRLDHVFNPPKLEKHPSFNRQERNLSIMKRAMHRSLIVKPDVATNEYLKHQEKMTREQGHGDVKIPARVRNEITEAVANINQGADMQEELEQFPNEQKQIVEEIMAKMEEQKQSLDSWLDYLSSEDAIYPDWLKYWTMRSVVGLSSYDKDEKRFPSRDETTTNPFPDLNREALAYVLDAVEKDEDYKQKVKTAKAEVKTAKKNHDKERTQAIAKRIKQIKESDPQAGIDRQAIAQEIEIAPFDESSFEIEIPEQPERPEEVQEGLDAKDFAKLYAWAIEKVTPTAENILHNTRGEWRKYDKGADHMSLVQAIQGHGTGWCTAGEATAESQLSRGDFYVYYSEDEKGEYAIPRAAIRMEGESIAEVRGIAQEQNLDPYIGEVVGEKMGEFGEEGKAYEKKAADMKRLTMIERKIYKDEELSKADLVFLYEIDGSIEGFGYQKDPRVQDLRSRRNPEEDAPIVFDCRPEQIAHSESDVNENTKAYIGRLFDDFFNKIPKSVEHIYTKFPEKPIWHKKLTIDHDKSLAEQVKDGNYDWVNEGIDRFTIKGEGQEEQELVLVNIDRRMSTSEVEAEISRLGLLLPEIVDLLAVGAQYPELQRNNFIVALLEEGSRVRNSRGYVVVPVLDEFSNGRELDLNYYGSRWGDSYRFLSRRK